MELENIKGIGPKTVNILRRLGINNTLDLVTYYPFRYDIIKKSDINLLEQDDKIIIDGVVETNAVVTYIRNHKDKMDFSLNVGEKIVKVTIFNRGFFKNKIIIGTNIGLREIRLSNINAIDGSFLMGMKTAGMRVNKQNNLGTLTILQCRNG